MQTRLLETDVRRVRARYISVVVRQRLGTPQRRKTPDASMPLAFGMFTSKISKLDKKLLLPPETALLIREQLARINICLFCIDIGRSFTIKASMNEAEFDVLEQYSTKPSFFYAS